MKPTTAEDRKNWPREYDEGMNPHGVSPVLTKKRIKRLIADLEKARKLIHAHDVDGCDECHEWYSTFLGRSQ